MMPYVKLYLDGCKLTKRHSMLKIGMHMTIITLWQQGQSLRAISRVTGRDRKTIKNAIEKYKSEKAKMKCRKSDGS